MFNEFVVVKVSAYKGEKESDRHGVQNVWLTPLAGRIPNQAMVVAGTVASQEDNKLEVGKTCLIQVVERDEDPVYGRQFGITVIQEVSGMEAFNLSKELGKGGVVVTKEPANGPNTNGILGKQNSATPTLNTSKLPDAKTAEEIAAEEAEAAEALKNAGNQQQGANANANAGKKTGN